MWNYYVSSSSIKCSLKFILGFFNLIYILNLKLYDNISQNQKSIGEETLK